MFSPNKNYPQKIRKYTIYPIAEGLALALFALFLTSITSFFIYHHALSAIEGEIKDGLLRTASGIAACLDADLIETFDSQEKSSLKSYQKMLKLLQKARLATKHCTYLYVNRMVNNKVYFILDPTPIDTEGKPLFSDKKNLEPSIPMTEYKGASKDLITALSEQRNVVTQNAYSDKWGSFYSAFIPIFNSRGKFIGTLGADLRIDDMYTRCAPMENATKRAFFVSIVLALLCGTLIWFTRRFSLQLDESRFKILNSLLETRKFAEQNSATTGKQLQRTGELLKNIASKIDSISKEKKSEKLQELLSNESGKLQSFSGKLMEIGKLRYSKRESKLENFQITAITDNLKTLLKLDKNDYERLKLEIDRNIPEVFGPVFEFEEQLSLLCSFYLNLFKGSINCKISMKTEEAKEIVVTQKVTASPEGLSEKTMLLLKKITAKDNRDSFLTDPEFIELASIPIICELVYLLNSDIEIKFTDQKFEICLEVAFFKSVETTERLEDNSESDLHN